ncbi:MFS transporter [Blastomonas sp.]|uniref:MFS transporter n=1 Tax=Blastomonas sp. TaxID=1909299 RepID=UPI002617B945|nr:MFS transporter [Blastomonas sp.]MDM7955752.1 MFS transporter [Blastomonas sp.]
MAHLVSFVDRFVLSLVMEPLKLDLGISDTELGLLQGTGFVILYVVVAIPLGRMADQVNRRNLIVIGIVLWSIATALCGLADSFGSLFLARLGVGFGEAALVPAAMSLLATYFPKEKLGRAVSLFTTGASLGKSAAMIGGGAVLALLVAKGGLALPVIGQLAPWQGTFVIMALPGFALALVIALTLREPKRAPVADPLAKPGFGPAVAHARAHRSAYIPHVAASITVVLLVQTIAAWSATFYVRLFDMTPSQAGLLVGSVILVAGPLGHLSGGWLTDRFARNGAPSPAAPVMTIGLLGAIPAMLVFAFSRDVVTSVVAYGLLNFSLTLGAPASLAGVQMLTPPAMRGVVTSVFLAIVTMVGIGVGPPLVGAITDFVFGDPDKLNLSLLAMVLVVASFGAAMAMASRTAFGRTMRTLE